MTAISRIPKAQFREYSPFSLDGRIKAKALPAEILPGTQPREITNGTARRIIEEVSHHGLSIHSSAGSTIWILIAWCREQKKPFQVWKATRGGRFCFHLDKINPAISLEGMERIL